MGWTMNWIRLPAAFLPSLVFFYFLNQGSQAVLGTALPKLLREACLIGGTDTLLALAVIAVLCGVFLGIVGLMFGDWAVRAAARHGGLRCCMFLGETYSGTRYYLKSPQFRDRKASQDSILIVETSGGAAPKAQNFRQIFRYHLLDEDGTRLEGREFGLQRAVEQLIISPVTLWLIFIFAGLAFLPSLVFEILQSPASRAEGLPIVLEPPFTDRVLLPAMPELALAFALTIAIGAAALWRRHRLMGHFRETSPTEDIKPRVQSGEILEGNIVERTSIDPGWYMSPQIGYSLKIDSRFEAPVIIGFCVASSPDCPLYKSLEHAVTEDIPVRVWVDPDAKVRPFMEPLPDFLEYSAPGNPGNQMGELPAQQASMMPNG